MPAKDFERLGAAMVVNKDFKSGVLSPESRGTTIGQGYLGKPFDFTEAELSDVLAIEEREKFTEFARQLNEIKNKHNPTSGS